MMANWFHVPIMLMIPIIFHFLVPVNRYARGHMIAPRHSAVAIVPVISPYSQFFPLFVLWGWFVVLFWWLLVAFWVFVFAKFEYWVFIQL